MLAETPITLVDNNVLPMSFDLKRSHSWPQLVGGAWCFLESSHMAGILQKQAPQS